MKKWLLMTTAAVALAVALPSQAAFVTCTNCEEEVSAALRQVEQLQQWASQLKSMADQITQLKDINGTLSHYTSLSGANSALGGFSRPTLPSASSLSGLMNGSSTTWGKANTRLKEDRVYTPNDSDDWSKEMERRERVTANAKAIAEAAYADSEKQIEQLDALKAEIEAAPDVTAVTAQSAGIALAQQRLTANAGMINQAQLMLSADDRVTQQRSEQRWRRDIDAWSDKTKSAMEGW